MGKGGRYIWRKDKGRGREREGEGERGRERERERERQTDRQTDVHVPLYILVVCGYVCLRLQLLSTSCYLPWLSIAAAVIDLLYLL